MNAMLNKARLPLAAACLLAALATVGCSSQRTVLAPEEPTWSYRDGQTQLSNNDVWADLIPTTAQLPQDESKVASVEDKTD